MMTRADINLDVEPAGMVNKQEAQHHKFLVEDALQDFKHCIEGGVVKDMMKQLVEEFKFIITWMYPAMEEADVIVCYMGFQTALAWPCDHRHQKWRGSWKTSCLRKTCQSVRRWPQKL